MPWPTIGVYQGLGSVVEIRKFGFGHLCPPANEGWRFRYVCQSLWPHPLIGALARPNHEDWQIRYMIQLSGKFEGFDIVEATSKDWDNASQIIRMDRLISRFRAS